MVNAYLFSGQRTKMTQQRHQHQKPNLTQINQAGGNSLRKRHQPLEQARRQGLPPFSNTEKTGGRALVKWVTPISW